MFLSTFRYRVPEDTISEPNNDYTFGYYKARAIYEGDLVNYTVSKDFLVTLNDVDLDELHKNKNKWSGIRFGDKNKQGTTKVLLDDIPNVNHFTHKNIPYTTCILSGMASAMWVMGLLDQATSFPKSFKQQ